MTRIITYAQAVNEAILQSMDADASVICYGLGVDDPKGVFGTTLGLKEKFGSDRVFDMPTSENAMTGVAIGASLNGVRPVMTHQRLDFFLLAMDQLVNNAAKWRYMFGGKMSVPLVIRLIIGRGWGQGPQHSQSLHSWFAHIPGLKVVMPTTPHDAKGLLVAAIEDDDPVIYLEHRWLHSTYGDVPQEKFSVPIGKARIVRTGKDVTLVTASYMAVECLKAAEMLAKAGVAAEIIDIRTLRTLDSECVLNSVRETGRLIVVEDGWSSFGLGAEIIALVAENAMCSLKASPIRLALCDTPKPTSSALANHCYPRAAQICNSVCNIMNLSPLSEEALCSSTDVPLDVPDKSFQGPF